MAKRNPLGGFQAHGVKFKNSEDEQGIGDCPFCGRRDKFYVNPSNLLWDCKTCHKEGNFGEFLLRISDKNRENLRGDWLGRLKQSRGLATDTLRAWEVGFNPSTQEYTIPVYTISGGELTDLRRYKIGGACMSTPGASAGLVNVQALEAARGKDPIVYIGEGEWDGMALSESIQRSKLPETSIAIAVPGAGVFKDAWRGIFQNLRVRIIYDYDDPRKKPEDRPGEVGEFRAFEKLHGMARNIQCVHWPKDAGLKDGYDYRDDFQALGAKEAFQILQARLKDSPRLESLPGRRSSANGSAPPSTAGFAVNQKEPTGDGLPWDDIVKGYRKWLLMNSEEPLQVMYGALFANRLDGDPLWLFMVAPPGGMKSELLMSLNQAPLIYSTTSLTPHALISGAQSQGGGDPSLLPLLDKKVLIIKDFTTILSMHSLQRDEILGILRDAYDGQAEKQFGTGLRRAYKARFGLIAGVTPVIEEFHQQHATLGERFLRYRIRTGGGSVSVGTKQIARALANLEKESNMRDDLMRLSGDALDRAIPEKAIPPIRKEDEKRLIALAQWTAAMRGVVKRDRYTDEIAYFPSQEIGTRLAKQLAKLGKGIAIAQRSEVMTDAIYRTLARVAKDTAPDRVEAILRELYCRLETKETASSKELGEWTRLPPATIAKVLQDMALLRVVQKEDSGGGISQTAQRWRITTPMRRLIDKSGVYDEEKEWRGISQKGE